MSAKRNHSHRKKSKVVGRKEPPLTMVRQRRTLIPEAEASEPVIEKTTVFQRRADDVFSRQEQEDLEDSLRARPDQGKVIPGGKGLRKMRWGAGGKGKRGGARIIYYWFNSRHLIQLVFVYTKGEQENLAPKELKKLLQLVEEG